jgi:hypothetical protein
MQIQLTPQIPKEDGYYLVRFGEAGGLHLVVIQTQLDGSRLVFADTHKKLFFKDFPTTGFWSEKIECNSVHG